MKIKVVRYNQISNVELLFGVFASQYYYQEILSMLDTNQKLLYIIGTIIFWLAIFYFYIKDRCYFSVSVSDSSDS